MSFCCPNKGIRAVHATDLNVFYFARICQDYWQQFEKWQTLNLTVLTACEQCFLGVFH